MTSPPKKELTQSQPTQLLAITTNTRVNLLREGGIEREGLALVIPMEKCQIASSS